jgi:hypothetical protein
MATRWPPIPKRVRGAGGPIIIRTVKRCEGDTGAAWGTWEPGTRIIRVERGAKPQHKWRVLFHELAHAAIDDAGIAHLLTADGQEAICDATATARIQEMRGELGIPE